MTKPIKLTENDFQVHQTEIMKPNEHSMVIWSNNFEQGVQLKQQILDNQKIVNYVIEMLGQVVYDEEGLFDKLDQFIKTTGKDIKTNYRYG